MAIFNTQTISNNQYLVIKSRNQEKLNLLDLDSNTIIHIAEQAELELNIVEGEYSHNLNIILTKGAKLKVLEKNNWRGTINWAIDLVEPYSEIEYITRLEAKNKAKNKAKNTITINHQASYTISKINSRYCIISPNKLIQHTIINIPKTIKNCQATQSAEILLLTDRPQIQIIPELRVATDNSNASHGVSIHPIQEKDIFYLMARGISQAKAIKILKKGFLEG